MVPGHAQRGSCTELAKNHKGCASVSLFKAQRRKVGSQWSQGGFCQGFAPRNAILCEVPPRAGAHRPLPWHGGVRPCMPQGAASQGPPGKSFAKGQAAKCVRRLLESREGASVSGWSGGVFLWGRIARKGNI